jgi:glucose/arabinose dehydrogenase
VWNSALNEIDPDSEVVLLDTPPATEAMHNSGKIEFGKDGMLYVTIGDQGISDRAQELDSVIGGMVRLTDTGDIPSDNPFANDAEGVRCNETGRGDGKCQELYAGSWASQSISVFHESENGREQGALLYQ